MNEQFDKLIYASGLIADGCWDKFDQYDKDALHKFAELIVWECARIAAQTPCPYTDETMKQQLGHTWDMACVASARGIRQHFKAEE